MPEGSSSSNEAIINESVYSFICSAYRTAEVNPKTERGDSTRHRTYAYVPLMFVAVNPNRSAYAFKFKLVYRRSETLHGAELPCM